MRRADRNGGHHRSRWFISWLGLTFLLLPSLGHAHKVNIFAFVEGGIVKVEGYFADGKKAGNSDVSVYGAGDKLLFKGVTDADGSISFPAPQESTIKIVLNAGLGHQSTFELSGLATAPAPKQEETPAAKPVTKSSAKVAPAVVSPVEEPGHSHPMGENERVEVPAAPASTQPAMESAEVDAAVRRAVSAAMAPLVKEIQDSQDRASLTEIIGGVGYIFGLMGVVAYMQARKGAAGAPRA